MDMMRAMAAEVARGEQGNFEIEYFDEKRKPNKYITISFK